MAKGKRRQAAKKTESLSENWIQSFPSLSRILSVVMLILGIIAIGALFYKVMAGFFVPLFLAALLVVIFRPIHTWIYHRLGDRPRMAAGVTTSVILMLVLLPIFLIISIAATEFTSMVSHVKNFDAIYEAVNRARDQFGLSLQYPDQFRRLDALSDELNQQVAEESNANRVLETYKIDEAAELIRFLQKRVGAPETARAAAAAAIVQLDQYRLAIQPAFGNQSTLETELDPSSPRRHRDVSASASIRKWMQLKLGGTFRAQICLLANPSAEELKRLLNSGP